MRAVTYDAAVHHEIVKSWWIEQKQKYLESEFLPKTGVIVFEGEKPILASWLWLTNSNLAINGFTISNPSAGLKQRARALDLAVQNLENLAEGLGVGLILVFCGSRGINKRMVRNNYFMGGDEHYLLMKAFRDNVKEMS